MRLLRILLPTIKPSEVKSSLPMFTDGATASKGCEQLINFLLLCIGNSIIPFEEKGDLVFMPPANAAFSLASECVMTLRLLARKEHR